MNREEKKDYLNSYLELKRQIDILTEEYHFWTETSQSVPASRLEASGIHGNRKKDKNIKYIDKHISICETIMEIQEEAEQKLKEILSVINSVHNANQRTVLKYRYINGWHFYKIARKMNYNLDHIFRLHRMGIDNLPENASNE